MHQFSARGGRKWGWALLSKLAPHIPQNFPVSKSGEPHDVHTTAGVDVGISDQIVR
jgi:hypothetical protein